MRTLNRYFGRELLRGFVLTAIALTMLVVMGGGVSSLFKSQGIGAGEILNIFLYLIPIALIFMLPLAALFAATITYGRAAADNEILACRAAGVNIHKLLAPPIVIGLLISGVWLWGLNFFIPKMLWSVEDITRRDVPAVVASRFLRGKPLNYGRYTISARQCDKIEAADVIDEDGKRNADDFVFLHLAGVSFMESNNGRLVRMGTADETIIQFDNSKSLPEIKVKMQSGRSFDAERNQYFEFEEQVLGPIEIPLKIRRKIRFENLWTLFEFRNDAQKIPEIEDLMNGMRKELKIYFLARKTDEIVKANQGDIEFYDKANDRRVKLSAYGIFVNEDDGRITLNDVEATVWESGAVDGTRYQAESARIRLEGGTVEHEPDIVVTLEDDVRITPAGEGGNARIIRKPSETLPRMPFKDQEKIYPAFQDFMTTSVQSLFDRDYEAQPDALKLFAKQKRVQQRLARKEAEYRSEVRGEIHFRLSISLAWLAVIVIGALLGIIIRSGQALVAFFISCIPCLFITVTALTARNLADRPDYSIGGIALLWGSTALLYVAVGVIGTRFLRR